MNLFLILLLLCIGAWFWFHILNWFWFCILNPVFDQLLSQLFNMILLLTEYRFLLGFDTDWVDPRLFLRSLPPIFAFWLAVSMCVWGFRIRDWFPWMVFECIWPVDNLVTYFCFSFHDLINWDSLLWIINLFILIELGILQINPAAALTLDKGREVLSMQQWLLCSLMLRWICVLIILTEGWVNISLKEILDCHAVPAWSSKYTLWLILHKLSVLV